MKKAVLVFSLILGLSAIGLRAQTAEDIIAKHITAMGGIEKIKALNSIKMTGSYMMMGMEFPFTVLSKRPLMTRIESTIQGMTMIQAYDGSTAWGVSPFMGSKEPEVMPEDQAKDIIERADYDGDFVDYTAKGHTIEFAGKDEVEGSPVFKLKVTKKSGDVSVYFIDAENYLQIKVVSKIKVQGTETESEMVYGNYKPVAGVQIPHSIESRIGGKIASQIVIEKVETNIPIENSIFVMPKKK